MQEKATKFHPETKYMQKISTARASCDLWLNMCTAVVCSEPLGDKIHVYGLSLSSVLLG